MQHVKITLYLAWSTDQIYVKGYAFTPFAKIWLKSPGKDISKHLSKYSQGLIDHVKQSATDTLKNASKIEGQKTEEEIGDVNGDKIVYNITKYLLQKNSQIEEERSMEIPKKTYT